MAGIEHADSIALDLHKWMQLPLQAGVVLVKHREAHRHTFSLTPDYLERSTRGLAGGDTWFSDYGLQLSRNFSALKAWLSFKEHGIKKYGRLMECNVEQAHYFASLVDQAETLELMAPVSLNIVCFRFNPKGLNRGELNALNRELLLRLHESGVAIPSYTTLDGKYCLRTATANHRSTFEDFDRFVNEILHLAKELMEENFLAGLEGRKATKPVFFNKKLASRLGGKTNRHVHTPARFLVKSLLRPPL